MPCARHSRAANSGRIESGEAIRVKSLDHPSLETMKERERIIVHPCEEHDDGSVTVDIGRATGLDPSTNDVAGELSKIATRIIEFVGLRGTTGKKRLVKLASAPGVALKELFDPCRVVHMPPARPHLTLLRDGARIARPRDVVM